MTIKFEDTCMQDPNLYNKTNKPCFLREACESQIREERGRKGGMTAEEEVRFRKRSIAGCPR